MIKKNSFSIVIFFLLICLVGCKRTQQFELKGHFAFLSNDTIYLYYEQENKDVLDTISVKDGSFHFKKKIKEPIIARLLVDSLREMPIFCEEKAHLLLTAPSVSSTSWQIKGGKMQQMYAALQAKVDSSAQNKQLAIVDSFIRRNTFSLVSVYALEHYFIPTLSLHGEQIRSLIKSLAGDLQDLPQMRRWEKKQRALQRSLVGKRAVSFTMKSMQNEYVSLAHFDGAYLLLTFWASWERQDSTLIAIKKQYAKEHHFSIKKNHFSKKNRSKKKALYFLDIALDQNKKEWLTAIQHDSLGWIQACSLKGWNTDLVTKYGIDKLPTTLLVGPDQKIIGLDIPMDSLSRFFKKNVRIKKK